MKKTDPKKGNKVEQKSVPEKPNYANCIAYIVKQFIPHIECYEVRVMIENQLNPKDRSQKRFDEHDLETFTYHEQLGDQFVKEWNIFLRSIQLANQLKSDQKLEFQEYFDRLTIKKIGQCLQKNQKKIKNQPTTEKQISVKQDLYKIEQKIYKGQYQSSQTQTIEQNSQPQYKSNQVQKQQKKVKKQPSTEEQLCNEQDSYQIYQKNYKGQQQSFQTDAIESNFQPQSMCYRSSQFQDENVQSSQQIFLKHQLINTIHRYKIDKNNFVTDLAKLLQKLAYDILNQLN